MQTRERHVSRPEKAAVARVAALVGASERDRAEIARLVRDLADMREDRDRWRAQAERLSAAADRKNAPPAPAPLPRAPAAVAASDEQDVLWGYAAIGAYVGLNEQQTKHRARKGQIPVFKQGRTPCATKSGLRAWLARQTATSQGGR